MQRVAKATLNKHSGWGGLYRGATSVSLRAAYFLFPFPTPPMWGLRVCTGKLFSCYFYVSYVVSYFELTLNPNKQVLLSMEFPVQGSVRTMRLQFLLFQALLVLCTSVSKLRNPIHHTNLVFLLFLLIVSFNYLNYDL